MLWYTYKQRVYWTGFWRQGCVGVGNQCRVPILFLVVSEEPAEIADISVYTRLDWFWVSQLLVSLFIDKRTVSGHWAIWIIRMIKVLCIFNQTYKPTNKAMTLLLWWSPAYHIQDSKEDIFIWLVGLLFCILGGVFLGLCCTLSTAEEGMNYIF